MTHTKRTFYTKYKILFRKPKHNGTKTETLGRHGLESSSRFAHRDPGGAGGGKQWTDHLNSAWE